jgi:hypothetical protein
MQARQGRARFADSAYRFLKELVRHGGPKTKNVAVEAEYAPVAPQAGRDEP